MPKLTAAGIKATKAPGRYHDGNGLMLVRSGNGAASWILRVQVSGKRREFGLGSCKDVGLAEARDRAADIRKQYRSGVDPVAERQASERVIPTFREAAKEYHSELKRGWKNGKHQAQWLSTLETHAFPKLGSLKVDAVDGGAIREVLLPIWLEIPETARRVRQRIGAVLDWAYANDYRSLEAPMRSVSKGLPRQKRVDSHFAAMPYQEVPAFVSALQGAEPTFGRLALQIAILTATRSGEVRGARWPEIDFEARIWRVPADRMKMGKPHAVPLSDAAIAVFRQAEGFRHAKSDLVFQGMDPGKPLSDMTLLKVVRDMGHTVTVHGFRSSFRDWVAEETEFQAEVAEAALAHTVPDKVVAAYRRTDFLEKRRLLMDTWAAHLVSTSTAHE